MAVFLSYDATVNHEDLLDIYKMLDPTEVWFQNYAGTAKANSDKVEWPIIALAAPASNSKVQGADVTAAAATAASRALNYTQTSVKHVAITETQEAINSAGDVDHLVKQKARKLRELVGDVEYALLINSAAVAGTSAVAGLSKGAVGWITTNKLTAATGGPTEANFNTVLELIWKAGGEVANVVAGSTICNKIDAFDADGTKFHVIDKGTITNMIAVYRTRYGIAKIVPHRIMESAAADKMLAFGDASYWKVAWLRKPKWEKLAKTGPSQKEFVECEYTLISFNEKASGQYDE